MTRILYIVHSTTIENEKGIASGQNDCRLSPLGETQARNLASLLQNEDIDFGTIFCSPLARAAQTAKILFAQKAIIFDSRLKEIDYGKLAGSPISTIVESREKYISTSYPAGESYLDVETRIRSFLEEHREKKTITVIAHQAPQLALEVVCKKVDWKTAIAEDWRLKKAWQPYWTYIKC